MTAIDEDDSVTGYAVSGGADGGLFAINSAGDLTFSTAPDFEAPADTDGDNVYEVTVTVTSGFGARALDAEQSLLVTVADITEPPAAPAAPELAPSAGSIAVSWLAPGQHRTADRRLRPRVPVAACTRRGAGNE